MNSSKEISDGEFSCVINHFEHLTWKPDEKKKMCDEINAASYTSSHVLDGYASSEIVMKEMDVLEELKNIARRSILVRRFMNGFPTNHRKWFGRIISEMKNLIYLTIQNELLDEEYTDTYCF